MRPITSVRSLPVPAKGRFRGKANFLARLPKGAEDRVVSSSAGRSDSAPLVTRCLTPAQRGLQVFIIINLKSFRMRTYEPDQGSLKTRDLNSFRIRTYGKLIHNCFRIRTYKKLGGGGICSRSFCALLHFPKPQPYCFHVLTHSFARRTGVGCITVRTAASRLNCTIMRGCRNFKIGTQLI